MKDAEQDEFISWHEFGPRNRVVLSPYSANKSQYDLTGRNNMLIMQKTC